MGAGDLRVLSNENGGVEEDGGWLGKDGCAFWGGGGAAVIGRGAGWCWLGGHCGLLWWLLFCGELRVGEVDARGRAAELAYRRIM
jgi:hypothetical protein